MSYDGFEGWEGVLSEFQFTMPEPDEVLVADYSTGSYEGDALVVYRIGDKYYTVEASHCSCYGLEGQFNPEEYDIKTFGEVLDRKKDQYQTYYGYGADTRTNWQQVRKLYDAYIALKKAGA